MPFGAASTTGGDKATANVFTRARRALAGLPRSGQATTTAKSEKSLFEFTKTGK